MTLQNAFMTSLGDIVSMHVIKQAKSLYEWIIYTYGEPKLIMKDDVDYLFHYDGFVLMMSWYDEIGHYELDKWDFRPIPLT